MNGLLEYFSNNPIITIISLLLAVLSIILAFVFYFKGKQKLEFSWVKSTYLIIANNKSAFEGLEMTFNKEPIDDLSVTKIVLWNSGNKEIRESDVYSNRQFCITSDDNVNILEAKILPDNNKNNYSIKCQEKNVLLCFECVEEKDGLAIQLIHTGEAFSIRVDGAIKGGKNKERLIDGFDIERPTEHFKFNITKLFGDRLPPTGFILLLLGFFDYLFHRYPADDTQVYRLFIDNWHLESLILVIAGAILIGLGKYLQHIISSQIMPSNLRKFI